MCFFLRKSLWFINDAKRYFISFKNNNNKSPPSNLKWRTHLHVIVGIRMCLLSYHAVSYRWIQMPRTCVLLSHRYLYRKDTANNNKSIQKPQYGGKIKRSWALCILIRSLIRTRSFCDFLTEPVKSEHKGETFKFDDVSVQVFECVSENSYHWRLQIYQLTCERSLWHIKRKQLLVWPMIMEQYNRISQLIYIKRHYGRARAHLSTHLIGWPNYCVWKKNRIKLQNDNKVGKMCLLCLGYTQRARLW